MFFGVPTINAFNSVVPASIMEYYPYIGISRDVSSKPDPENYWTRGLTSVRYLVADGRDEYKEVRGFERIGSDGDFVFYENTNYIPMGFTYDKMVSRSLLDTAGEYQRSGIMMEAMCIEDEDLMDAAKYLTSLQTEDLTRPQTYERYVQNCADRRASCTSTFTAEGDGFTSVITLDRENLVFYSVPYDKGWSAWVDGEPAKIYKANVGFMAVVCPEGTSTVEFRYISPGFVPGVWISAGSTLLLAGYWVACKKFGKKQTEELNFVPDKLEE